MWRAYSSSDKTIRLFCLSMSCWSGDISSSGNALFPPALEVLMTQWVWLWFQGWVAGLTLGYVFMAAFSFKHQKRLIWLRILLLYFISSYIKYYAKLMLQQSFVNVIWKEDFLIIIQLASVAYNGTALFYCLAVLVETSKIHML